SLSGSEAAAGPGGAARDLVCAAYRDLVAASAARARLRVRGDLLAADGRVAEGRRLGAAARAPAREVAGRRRDRAVARGRRLDSRASEKGSHEGGLRAAAQ